jgi:hypothetical protein
MLRIDIASLLEHLIAIQVLPSLYFRLSDIDLFEVRFSDGLRVRLAICNSRDDFGGTEGV